MSLQQMKPTKRPHAHMHDFLMQLQIIQRICIHHISLNMTGVRKAGVCLQRTLELNKQNKKTPKTFQSCTFSPLYKQDVKLYFPQEFKGSQKLFSVLMLNTWTVRVDMCLQD